MTHQDDYYDVASQLAPQSAIMNRAAIAALNAALPTFEQARELGMLALDNFAASLKDVPVPAVTISPETYESLIRALTSAAEQAQQAVSASLTSETMARLSALVNASLPEIDIERLAALGSAARSEGVADEVESASGEVDGLDDVALAASMEAASQGPPVEASDVRLGLMVTYWLIIIGLVIWLGTGDSAGRWIVERVIAALGLKGGADVLGKMIDQRSAKDT